MTWENHIVRILSQVENDVPKLSWRTLFGATREKEISIK